MVSRRAVLASVFIGLMLISGPAAAQVGPGHAYAAEAAIMSAGTRAAAVSRLRGVPSVGVIRLYVRYTPFMSSDWPDVAEWQILAQKFRPGVQRLRAALSANPATRTALTSRGIAIGRVVGIDIYSNGSIRVYLL